MGSIDAPQFVRDRMKQQIQQKTEPSISIDAPDFIKKKEGGITEPPPTSVQSTLPSAPQSKSVESNPPVDNKPIITTDWNSFGKDADNFVLTHDGVKIPLNNTVVPKDAIPSLVTNLQQKINTKSATQDDINIIAQASGKKPTVVQAYIKDGAVKGAAIENNDYVDEQRQKVSDYISSYNRINGTQYDPQEVMSSADKLNDFLNASKKENTRLSKEVRIGGKLDLSKPLTPKQSEQFAFLNYGVVPIRNEMINQIVQKTVQELPKDKAIDKIASVLNPTDYQKVKDMQKEGWGIKDFLTTAPTPLSVFKSDYKEQGELFNYQKGIAELKYNDALRQNALNKISKGTVDGNEELVNEGHSDLSNVDENVISKYPALQKQRIAQEVNDYIAKKSGVVKGYDAETFNDYKEKVFGSSTQDRLDAMRALGILDDPKQKDIAESMASNSTYFANNSILGGAVPSFLQPIGELGYSIGDITGLRSKSDVFADKIKDQLFPKDFTGNNPNDPNQLQLKSVVQHSKTAVNTTFNLAGMMAIATVTEGVGTELGVSRSVAQKLGAYTSFGLPAFDESLKNHPESITSEPAKYLYAAINSIANAEGGRVLDLGKITRIPGVSEVFAEAANKISTKSITEQGLRELLNSGKAKYVDFAMKYGKNVTKGAATMAYFTTANNVVRMAFGDKDAEANLLPQAGHAFVDGLLGMSVMGAFGAVSDMRREKNTTFKNNIYNLALNHDAAADILKMGLDNGMYTKPQYDEKMQILNTARAAKNSLDAATIETGINLDANQKAVYVANKTAQKVFENKAAQEGIPEATKNKYLEQAKRLSEQSTQTLDGLKYTPTLQPLYELYNAEKEFDAAKENYNPADKASSDALESAKSVYDKLYSDYLADNSAMPIKEDNVKNETASTSNNVSVIKPKTQEEIDNQIPTVTIAPKENTPETKKGVSVVLPQTIERGREMPTVTVGGKTNENATEKTAQVPKSTEAASTTNEAANKVEQPTEESLVSQAKDLVNSGVVKGYTAETLKESANNNPAEFQQHLKDISEQANDPKSNKATVDTYGKELVDIAQKLNPVEIKGDDKLVMPKDLSDENASKWINDNYGIHIGTKNAKQWVSDNGYDPNIKERSGDKIGDEVKLRSSDKSKQEEGVIVGFSKDKYHTTFVKLKDGTIKLMEGAFLDNKRVESEKQAESVAKIDDVNSNEFRDAFQKEFGRIQHGANEFFNKIQDEASGKKIIEIGKKIKDKSMAGTLAIQFERKLRDDPNFQDERKFIKTDRQGTIDNLKWMAENGLHIPDDLAKEAGIKDNPSSTKNEGNTTTPTEVNKPVSVNEGEQKAQELSVAKNINAEDKYKGLSNSERNGVKFAEALPEIMKEALDKQKPFRDVFLKRNFLTYEEFKNLPQESKDKIQSDWVKSKEFKDMNDVLDGKKPIPENKASKEKPISKPISEVKEKSSKPTNTKESNFSKKLKDKYKDFNLGGTKDADLSGSGRREITLPDGTKETVKPIAPEIVNGFYSPIEKKILTTKDKSLSANKWRERFGKGDEAKFTGILDFLNSKKPNEQVSKQEVLDYIKNNRIQLVEVVKGEKPKIQVQLANIDSRIQEYRRERDGLIRETKPYRDKGEQVPTKISERIAAINDSLLTLNRNAEELRNKNNVKFETYQLPGERKNYKEVLITMPISKSMQPFELKEGERGEWYVENKKTGVKLNFGSKELAERQYKKLSEEPQPDFNKQFKSQHFDEPNILAHLRMSTRTDAEGNKVLLVDEIQSDWQQKARKEGIIKSDLGKGFTAKETSDMRWTVYDESGRKVREAVFANSEKDAIGTVVRVEKERGVPDAPFISDTNQTTKLALKYALRHAVEEGASRIAWATGSQQNERYDLSKQVDYIQYEDGFGNNRYVDISHASGISTLYVDKTTGIVKEVKNQDIPNAVGKPLSDIIGKDIAEKVLSDKKSGRLEGEGLKIGGKGMVGFYGEPSEGKIGIVGNVAKGLVKELTGTEGKIVDTRLDTDKGYDAERVNVDWDKVKVNVTKVRSGAREGLYFATLEGGGLFENVKKDGDVHYFEHEKDARDFAQQHIEESRDQSKYLSTQHSIEITPELKAAVEGGLPLLDKSKIKTDNGTQTIDEYVAKGKAVLNKLFPDATFEAYKTHEEFEKAGGVEDSRGTAITEADGSKRILLNLAQMKEDGVGKTAFHEVIHPIVSEVFGKTPEELAPIWNEIASTMKDAKGMDKVWEHLVWYSEHKTPVEGITEFLTQVADGNIKVEDIPAAKQSKIVDLINKLFEKLGINFKIEHPLDLQKFANDIKTAFETGDVESLKNTIDSRSSENRNASENANKINTLLFGKDADFGLSKGNIKEAVGKSIESVRKMIDKGAELKDAIAKESDSFIKNIKSFDGIKDLKPTFEKTLRDNFEKEALNRFDKESQDRASQVESMVKDAMDEGFETLSDIKEAITNGLGIDTPAFRKMIDDAYERVNEGGGGKVPPTERVDTDSEDFGDKGQRRFTKQVLKDEAILPKEEIQKNLDYIRQKNVVTVKEAEDVINKVGVDEAYDLVVNDGELKPAVRTTVGQMLIKKFNTLAAKAPDQETKEYYWDKTIKTADFVSEKLGTEAGQGIQTFALFSKLSPEAQTMGAIKEVKRQAQRRIEKRKPDVNDIGDKFKKANEETVEEITKEKEVRTRIENAEKSLSERAQDKIKKARARREKIIAKYKSEKRTNLYSGVGLTKEGIEYVGELAKTYIDEGVANLQIIADKIKDHLVATTNKDVDENVYKSINEVVSKKLNQEDLKTIGGVKDLKIGQIVKEHYTVVEKTKSDLVKRLVEESGLEKEEAQQLATKIQDAFDRVATRKKQDILAREAAKFNRIKKDLDGAKKVDKKTLQAEIIKFSNLGAFDNDGLLAMLGERLGTGQLTPEQGKEIQRLAEQVQTAPEGSPKADATQDLLKYRANLKGNSWAEITQGVWYANVLSGYMTHIRNIVSTFFNGTAFVATELARDPKSLPILLYGGARGFKRGGIEAWHTLTTGRSPIHISKIETPQVLERIRFKGGLLNPVNYLKYVNRLMVAEDVIQFQGLKEMRATQLAYREAKRLGYKNPFSKAVWKYVNENLLNTKERYEVANEQAASEGFKGNEARRRTYELMEQSRPIQMQDDAYGFAAKGTFNHDTEGTLGALSDWASRFIDNGLSYKGAKPLRFLVPFTRIITNVANNSLDFSPIGLVRGARGERGLFASETSGKKTIMSKEERQQELIKGALGTASMLALYGLSQAGVVQVSGAGPSDYRKRLQLQQEGWQPFSIKIGKTYYSYKLTPMVFAWGVVGSIRDHEQYDKDSDEQTLIERSTLAVWDGARLISDMTWVNSAAPIMAAISESNPGAAGTMLSNTATGIGKGFVLPSAYTQSAEKIEQIFHVPQKQTKGLFQSLITNVPIARNQFNDKINALGDPIVKDVDILTSKETIDPVWKFLLDKKGWVAPVNRNTLILFDINTREDRPATDDEYYEFSKIRGAKIKEDIKKMIQEGAYVKTKEGYQFKKAEDLTSAELNKVLTPIKTRATKEAKNELLIKANNSKNKYSY